jgi:hypothetical protein
MQLLILLLSKTSKFQKVMQTLNILYVLQLYYIFCKIFQHVFCTLDDSCFSKVNV